MMDAETKTMTLDLVGVRRDLLRQPSVEVELPLYGRFQEDIDDYTYHETCYMIDNCKALGAQLTIAAGSIVGARLFYDDKILSMVQQIEMADPEERFPVRRITRQEFAVQLAQVRQWVRIEAANTLIDIGEARTSVPVLNES